MAVTVDHRIDRRLDPEIDHGDRRIDDHRLPRPLDQQRIARRVGTVVRVLRTVTCSVSRRA